MITSLHWLTKIIVGAGLFLFFNVLHANEQNPLQMDFPDSEMTAPEFIVQDLKGAPLSLKSFQGKIVLLNFWATWCAPCIKEMPEFNELANSLNSDDFVVIAINVKDSVTKVERFVKQHEVSALQIGLDVVGSTYKSYAVQQFPTTFILNRQGHFIGKIIGPRSWMGDKSYTYFKSLIQK